MTSRAAARARSVAASSWLIRREYPATSAAKIAASRRSILCSFGGRTDLPCPRQWCSGRGGGSSLMKMARNRDRQAKKRERPLGRWMAGYQSQQECPIQLHAETPISEHSPLGATVVCLVRAATTCPRPAGLVERRTAVRRTDGR